MQQEAISVEVEAPRSVCWLKSAPTKTTSSSSEPLSQSLKNNSHGLKTLRRIAGRAASCQAGSGPEPSGQVSGSPPPHRRWVISLHKISIFVQLTGKKTALA